MMQKFPQDVGIKNEMAVSYLMIGQGKEAAKMLEQVILVLTYVAFLSI